MTDSTLRPSERTLADYAKHYTDCHWHRCRHCRQPYDLCRTLVSSCRLPTEHAACSCGLDSLLRASEIPSEINRTEEKTMQQGTSEPYFSIDGKDYTRERCFAAYTKADYNEALTPEESRLAVGYAIHPLNGPIGLVPYVIGSLLLRRQLPAVADPETASIESEARIQLRTLAEHARHSGSFEMKADVAELILSILSAPSVCDPSGSAPEDVDSAFWLGKQVQRAETALEEGGLPGEHVKAYKDEIAECRRKLSALAGDQRQAETELREALRQALEQFAAGWDTDGLTGLKPPYSWESVARAMLDIARDHVSPQTGSPQ